MEEAHADVCGVHQLGPKLCDSCIRMGYYWLTMVRDCIDFARWCDACQLHANFIHQVSEPLHPTAASWPFEAHVHFSGLISSQAHGGVVTFQGRSHRDWFELLGLNLSRFAKRSKFEIKTFKT